LIVVDASVLAAVLIDAEAPASDEAIEVLQADPHWVVPGHAIERGLVFDLELSLAEVAETNKAMDECRVTKGLLRP